MIELKHLGKIYSSASGSVEALKDVNQIGRAHV